MPLTDYTPIDATHRYRRNLYDRPPEIAFITILYFYIVSQFSLVHGCIVYMCCGEPGLTLLHQFVLGLHPFSNHMHHQLMYRCRTKFKQTNLELLVAICTSGQS